MFRQNERSLFQRHRDALVRHPGLEIYTCDELIQLDVELNKTKTYREFMKTILCTGNSSTQFKLFLNSCLLLGLFSENYLFTPHNYAEDESMLYSFSYWLGKEIGEFALLSLFSLACVFTVSLIEHDIEIEDQLQEDIKVVLQYKQSEEVQQNRMRLT